MTDLETSYEVEFGKHLREREKERMMQTWNDDQAKLNPALLHKVEGTSGSSNDQGTSSKQLPNCIKVVGKERQLLRRTNSSFPVKQKTLLPQSDKGQDDVDSSTVTSGVSIPVSVPEKDHEALAGPDPEPMNEDQTGSDSGKLHTFCFYVFPEEFSDDSVNFGDQFLHDKPTEDDQEKSKTREESGSTIPDPSHQTGTSSPPVIPPFTEIPSSKPLSLVTPPPINTEATTITTSLPKLLHFHRPFRTKLDDALLKVLERHTADLIKKYSVLPGPESVKNQDSEKSPKEIIKAKKRNT
ncbi:hypothetical protein Tco_0316502 [Tanacetum coccineum]